MNILKIIWYWIIGTCLLHGPYFTEDHIDGDVWCTSCNTKLT